MPKISVVMPAYNAEKNILGNRLTAFLIRRMEILNLLLSMMVQETVRKRLFFHIPIIELFI